MGCSTWEISRYIIHITLPETNILVAPENGWLEYDRFLLGRMAYFQGRTVSLPEGIMIICGLDMIWPSLFPMMLVLGVVYVIFNGLLGWNGRSIQAQQPRISDESHESDDRTHPGGRIS